MKIVLFAAAALAISSTAHAQTAPKLTAYSSAWDTSHAGEPLMHVSGWPLAFNDTFKYRSVAADGVVGSNWYAPIHAKLGTGALAQASNTAAISVDAAGLELQTINPSSSGAGATDANVETMDNHGHGFSFTNGYVEIEAALPTAHGSHAGLWLLNVQQPAGHGEIDAPETYGAADHVASTNVHWWNAGGPEVSPPGRYWGIDPSTYYGQLHRYGILVTPTEIITYDDTQCALGPKCALQERQRIARAPAMVAPMYLLMSNFTDAKRQDGYEPSKLTVRYVKVWGK